MGDTNDTSPGGHDFKLARRQLLKGAAAAGVGTVVWSAPHIRTLGTVPAGATHTATTGVTSVLSDCDSINANCASGGFCAGDPEWGGASNPQILTVKNFPSNGLDVLVEVFGCVNAVSTRNAIVGTNPPGYTCTVEDILISNGGNAATKFKIAGSAGTGCPDALAANKWPGCVSDPDASNGVDFALVPVGNGNCPYFLCVTVTCVPI